MGFSEAARSRRTTCALAERASLWPCAEVGILWGDGDEANRTIGREQEGALTSLTGLSHISLSVANRDASVDWYCRVLGFDVLVPQMDSVTWKRSILLHPSGLVLGFTQHLENSDFDPRNVGIDHLSFGVADRSDLEKWSDRFAELGVVHSPVADSEWGEVLSFRDPDNIQLELFHTRT